MKGVCEVRVGAPWGAEPHIPCPGDAKGSG